MAKIHERIYEGEKVVLDDNHWFGCAFNNCTIVLKNGTGSVEQCSFNNCTLSVDPSSPAHSVLQMYEMFNKGSIKFN